jgi:hypothetical protein
MKKLDLILFVITIAMIVLILFLIQALSNENILKVLNALHFFDESVNGMKNMVITILALAVAVSFNVLLIVFRIITKNMKKKNDQSR